MGIDLADYQNKTREAVKAFWGNRGATRQKQLESGRTDQGERGGVTGGNNMNGFLALAKDIVLLNGLAGADVHVNRGLLTLPGYFRPAKSWEVLVTKGGRLVAALEFKSQVGPSFGNNFNNRAEEAVGTALDFWTAYREGAFGENSRPFVGWLVLVEDCAASHTPVRNRSPHFPAFPDFRGASYCDRYNSLCKKLVQEKLYTAASVIILPRSAIDTGECNELAEPTSLTTFVAAFAGHIATEAVRS